MWMSITCDFDVDSKEVFKKATTTTMEIIHLCIHIEWFKVQGLENTFSIW